MGIVTSHSLARELLNKPDGFITISTEDGEYTIGNIKRKSSHANMDDSVMYWTLKGEYKTEGNVIRWYVKGCDENMIDDDTLETGVKEKKNKTESIFTWLFDFYLTFILTISALICIPYAFNNPKVGIPVIIFSGIMAVTANL